MNNKKPTVRILPALILPILAWMSLDVLADSHTPPPPVIIETYTCNLNPGQDMDDLMSARDYYVKQAEKAGVTLGNEYLWTLNKGDLPFRLVWMAVHDSMAAYAAATDAAAASSEMMSTIERFETVVTCSSGIGVASPMYQRDPEPEGDGSAVVTGSACRYKHGMGPAEMADLSNHIGSVMKGMGDNAPNFAFNITPITSGPNTPDILLFSVNDSYTQWANVNATFRSSEAGQALGRHFNTVLDCGLALWDSRQVVGGND